MLAALISKTPLSCSPKKGMAKIAVDRGERYAEEETINADTRFKLH